MIEKIKNWGNVLRKNRSYQRLLLVILIVICLLIILIGGVRYVRQLRQNLQYNAIENLMTVTSQQQQDFDTFIAGDQERLHSFANYFASKSSQELDELERQMGLFYEVDAEYTLVNLNTGMACNNLVNGLFQMDSDRMDNIYQILNQNPNLNADAYCTEDVFGYYERFSFSDGVPGLIMKRYDRNKVSQAFSLSFYNQQGLAYVVDQKGEILLRPVALVDDQLYENIFDIITGIYNQEEQADEIEAFQNAIRNRESGSTIFNGDHGKYVYTYVPIVDVDNWYLISIVPMRAISQQTDQMLLDSQMALGLLLLILVVCAILIALIWRTHKDLEDKERRIQYQAQLFNIFVTYLAHNTDDVYFMVDEETNQIEYASPNLDRVLGVSQENLLGLLKEEDMEQDQEAALEYYREVESLEVGQSATPHNTIRINSKTGERKYFLENAYCVLLQGRRKRIVYISDRTNEHTTQQSLTEALHMAQAANDAKSSFLSSVSHDIRTPMNAIIGFLSLMQNEADHPEIVLEYAQRIDAASQHLLGLINDVLDMNKIESGSATLNISEINIAEIINEINTIIRPQTRAKQQTFDIFASHLEHEKLLGDKLRINQILINLLSNAVKYTPDDGIIEMFVEELEQIDKHYSRLRFTIKDNGLGMSEDYLKVIFDPFTREETSATRKIQGTGLGMAITKSLVDLMGGSITVESALNQGSTFVVELELRIQETKESDSDHQVFFSEHQVTRMIVADDDEDVCLNIVQMMAQTGVTTDYATDGQTAIQMMREARESGKPYDLILLDWKMPNLNGLETARLIRKNYSKKIPILLLTAYDWSEIEQEAKEIGVNYFLSKPFFMMTFKEAIRRVMGSLKKEQQKEMQNQASEIINNRHILVVDDIEVNRIILVKILKNLGAECDTAVDGQDAVNKFLATSETQINDDGSDAKRPYDLILMDVQMPVMDGYTATRTIRASEHTHASRVPIIAMTANAFVDDVRDALASGMDAHIAKPVQLANLKSTIQQVFDKRKQEESEKQM